MDGHETHIGYEVRTLDKMIRNRVKFFHDSLDKEEGLTQIQAWIIGYLYRNSDAPVFQRDLEAEFRIPRSTATGVLQQMEKKGVITREPVPEDARLKKLVLTDRGLEYQRKVIKYLDLLDSDLREGISQEELDIFFKVVRKLQENAERTPSENHSPERRETRC